jgi:hypothetical protein
MRIKSPRIKNNQREADEAMRLVRLFHGVNSVECNLITGSLLINYHPEKLHKKDLVEVLSEKGFFDRTKAVTHDEYFKRSAAFFTRQVMPDLLMALI